MALIPIDGKIGSQCTAEYGYSLKFNLTRSTSHLYYMQSTYILKIEYRYTFAIG